MSDESDVLDAAKDILPDLDPTPEPAPANVWVYPADYDEINFERLPVVIASQVVNRPIPWKRATYGYGLHQWPLEILCFLVKGPLVNDKQAAEAEVKHSPWLRAMSNLLFQNLTLNDTCIQIGGEAGLFTYQIGHIHFWTEVCWGIRFEVMVTQKPIQATAA